MSQQSKTVELYTLSTCPWSRSAKAFLEAHRVKYSYIDYDLADHGDQSRIQREMLAQGAAAFPYTRIGEDFIVGYNPDAFTRLLELEPREER
jgi:glutaredoxin